MMAPSAPSRAPKSLRSFAADFGVSHGTIRTVLSLREYVRSVALPPSDADTPANEVSAQRVRCWTQPHFSS
jgi:hypothetical protein